MRRAYRKTPTNPKRGRRACGARNVHTIVLSASDVRYKIKTLNAKHKKKITEKVIMRFTHEPTPVVFTRFPRASHSPTFFRSRVVKVFLSSMQSNYPHASCAPHTCFSSSTRPYLIYICFNSLARSGPNLVPFGRLACASLEVPADLKTASSREHTKSPKCKRLCAPLQDGRLAARRGVQGEPRGLPARQRGFCPTEATFTPDP